MRGVSIGPLLTIKDFATSNGCSPALLRAWEVRYGLFRPRRTTGGYRLYDHTDTLRLKVMLTFLDDGYSASAAAKAALLAHPLGVAKFQVDGHSWTPELVVDRLIRQEQGTFAETMDGFMRARGPAAMVEQLVLPAVRSLGTLWLQGQLAKADGYRSFEIARHYLEGRERPEAPVGLVWVASPPGENHTLVLYATALLLRSRGWATQVFTGENSINELVELTRGQRPDFCLMGVQRSIVLRRRQYELRQLTRSVPTIVAGPGARAHTVQELGAGMISRDVGGTVAELDARARRYLTGDTPDTATFIRGARE